jgi:chromosome segregation ATPase
MTNPGPEPDVLKAGKTAANAAGPPPELVEQFRELEARVVDAVRLIEGLRRDKRELEARLEEAARARAEASRRIDELLDKIDRLL